jgi:RNA ligase
MVQITDLMSLGRLQQEIDNGYVKRVMDPTGRLAILSYTNKAQISKSWTTERLLSRGLVYDMHTHNVIARPLAKFFNYGESQPRPSDNVPVLVTDKLDGSLGILFHDDHGQPHVVTRGSFSSPQAAHATKLYRERYHGKWTPKPHTTYLFEIIFPDNRIVLNYGLTDDLFGLCAVDIHTGGVSYLKEAWADWPGPLAQTFTYKTLADAINAPARANAEGLVVQLLDGSGTMLKIKQDNYKSLHKNKNGLTPTAIWEALSKGATPDDICGLCDVDEQYNEIRKTANELLEKYKQRKADIEEQFQMLVAYGGDKRKFAEKVLSLQCDNSKYLFALRSGKDISGLLWEAFKP